MGRDAGATVVFVHCPRTAGSAWWRYSGFDSATDGRPSVVVKGPGPDAIVARLRALGNSEPRPLALRAHFPFGARECLPAEVTLVTMLRDPVERVVSHYHYALTNPMVNSALGLPPIRPGMTLEEALHEGSLPGNLQTRLLSNASSVTDPADGDRLEEAKRNLREFAVVGLTERFDESLVLLQTELGIAPRTYRGERRPPTFRPSPEQRAEIGRQNAFDADLYEVAQRIFEAQLEARRPQLQIDVDALRLSRQEHGVAEHQKGDLRAALVGARADLLTARLELQELRGVDRKARKTDEAGEPLIAAVVVDDTALMLIADLLAARYGSAACVSLGTWADVEQAVEKLRQLRRDPASSRACRGQLPLAVMRRYLPSETRYITMLQDPMAHASAHDTRLPDNFQTRLFCDSPKPWKRPADHALLKEAKHNLEQFTAVGIMGRFADSMALIAGAVGFETTAEKEALPMPTAASGEITPSDERRVELDLELYAFARERMEKLSAAAI